MYPMKLSSVTKSPIWGGTKLLTDWGKISDSPTVGESWELSVRTKENCLIENGIFAGKTLKDVISAYPAEMMGADDDGGGFPLLIKLIDAHDDLSVQVHPDDEYASRVENDRGKTEMWYVVDADEGAKLVFGIADGLTKEDFAAAVRENRIETVLRYVPVRPGDVFFIPAGLLHAIGKGILIAEIQQNCDLTYRVFDYYRKGADGKPRELHIQKALDVVRSFTEDEINAIRYENCGGKPNDPSLLADCNFFRVSKLDCNGATRSFPSTGKMRHFLALSGSGSITVGGTSYHAAKGDSYFLPADLDTLAFSGTLSGILTEV